MIIRGAEVFNGERWLGAAEIVVENGIVQGSCAGTQGDIIRMDGMIVIPGLIDAHIHLFPGFLSRLPRFGVTSVVDMFATPNLIDSLSAERSEFTADYISAGIGATAPGGHPVQLVGQGLYKDFPVLARTDNVTDFVAQRKAEGSGFIKVFLEKGELAGKCLPSLDVATVRALCRAAHDVGLLVVAHAVTVDAALAAIDGGIDGLAHAVVPDRNPDHLIDRMLAEDVFMVSTLVALGSTLGYDHTSLFRESLPISRGWRSHLAKPAGRRLESILWENTRKFMTSAIARGVRVLPGTDAAFPGVAPGASMHAELALLQDCGLSPVDAICAATAEAAAVFKLDRAGLIEPGYPATMLFLTSDPRNDVRATQDIGAIMLNGHLKSFQKSISDGET